MTSKTSKGKSFRKNIDAANPVLQFISTSEEQPVAVDTAAPPANVEAENYQMPPVKTSGFNPSRTQTEIKSKHLHLIVKPSLFKRLKSRAAQERMSVNEFVHLALEYILNEHEHEHVH